MLMIERFIIIRQSIDYIFMKEIMYEYIAWNENMHPQSIHCIDIENQLIGLKLLIKKSTLSTGTKQVHAQGQTYLAFKDA